jgi:thymidylate kinase
VTLDQIARHRTVVIEGCDGAGKSNLARQLVAQYGFVAVHCPRTPDHQDLMNRYRELLARPGRLALDRSFLSELVYGPLYRNGSRLTWDQALALAHLVTQRDGIFLHLTEPPEVLCQRLVDRDGEAPDLRVISDLADAYEIAVRTLSSHVPVLTYSPASGTIPTTG